MARRYGDEVDVRLRDGVPEQFLWRGRLYLVREVLARWGGTGAWWRSNAVSGGGPAIGLPGRSVPSGAVVAVVDPVPDSLGVDLAEKDFWRVAAGSGRSVGTGVYELCFERSRGRWVLARALD